jgi:TatD DNase family protein
MSAAAPVEGLRFYDAHLHLQDKGLTAGLSDHPEFPGVVAQISNGTHPDDWAAVRELADSGDTRVLKAYGVHPWRVDDLPTDWETRLREHLEADAASVGEIGLDHWIEVKDERWQIEVFERQLGIAAEENLVPTIHCLRAWGLLVDCLRAGPDLKRGFLVHGFGGSTEILHELLDLGGHVSFSAYAADPKRKRMRDAIKACPDDRLLAETDAPDMVPPEKACRFPLKAPDGKRLHHPMEIKTAYALLAELRGVAIEKLTDQIEANFKRLFMA